MLSFAKRNWLMFFRKKSTVFFSFLGVLIILALYMLFLGDVWESSLRQAPIVDIRALMANWIIAGMVSVTPVTTALGAFGVMVEDAQSGVIKDFYTAPLRRSSLVGGYLLSACGISFVLSMTAFLLGEGYVLYSGGRLLSPAGFLQMTAAIAGSVIMSGSMVFLLVTFVKTVSTFSVCGNLVGTLIGFLTGIYLPMEMMPEAVRWVVRLFPVTHISALMRQIMMRDAMAHSFAGAPEAVKQTFADSFGVTLTFGSYTAQPWVHIAVMAVCAALCLAAAVLKIRVRNK